MPEEHRELLKYRRLPEGFSSVGEAVSVMVALGDADALGTILQMAEHLKFNDYTKILFQERAEDLEAELVAVGVI